MRVAFLSLLLLVPAGAAELRGRIVDASTGQLVAARVYLQDAGGAWHLAASADPGGFAIPYSAQRPATGSVEIHTSLSPHPFHADLPAGRITVRVERGMEYSPAEITVDLPATGAETTVPIHRWINLNQRGWFSGDVFLHRPRVDCATLSLAEDLNVLFPIHYWTTASGLAPARGNQTKGGGDPLPTLDVIDATHVVWPVNTEVELFTVDGKPHMQGAFWVFGHRGPLTAGAPPVGPIARQIREQGGFIDTEKPNWPWTIMLVPTMQPRFFRLLNNHHWRTAFGSGSWKPVDAPDWMACEKDSEGGWTEAGWTEFGLRCYYALLNCGFRLIPTAGTGSGVHPVPAGFSRTYVRIADGFSYDKWMAGLAAGGCFVTNGPSLLATFDGRPPGHVFGDFKEGTMTVQFEAAGASEIQRVELVMNGEVIASLAGKSDETTSQFRVPITRSGWLALRAWEMTPAGGRRLAHTAPVWCEVTDFPARPRKQETAWMIQRLTDEISRHRGVLPDDALNDYEQALSIFRDLDARAR